MVRINVEDSEVSYMETLKDNVLDPEADVWMVRYHVNDTDEVQSKPVDITNVHPSTECLREAIHRALPEGVIAWSAWEAEFEFAQYPPDSGWYVPEDAECDMESV